MPVMLELLALQEQELIPRPLGLVLFAESERAHIEPLLHALGYADSLRTITGQLGPTLVLT
jgi:hypothetical protein